MARVSSNPSLRISPLCEVLRRLQDESGNGNEVFKVGFLKGQRGEKEGERTGHIERQGEREIIQLGRKRKGEMKKKIYKYLL